MDHTGVILACVFAGGWRRLVVEYNHGVVFLLSIRPNTMCTTNKSSTIVGHRVVGARVRNGVRMISLSVRWYLG